MRRLIAFLALALAAGIAAGDAAPPPGFRLVTLDYKITTDKDFPDYAFYTVVVDGQVTAVKFDSKTPVSLLGKNGGRRFLGWTLVAVPKDAAKKYDSEGDFHSAIRSGKVEGQVKAKEVFSAQREVKDAGKRNPLLVEYKVTQVGAKGIVLVAQKDEAPKEAPKNGKDSPDDDSDFPVRWKCGNDGPEDSFDLFTSSDAPPGHTPRGGMLVAGLAGFGALTLGGLWVIGRTRRKA